MGKKPLARIAGYAVAGVDPEIMGIGPVPATKKALTRAGFSLGDIQLIEINEAFAAQYLACEKLIGWDRQIVNVNGSGISLGHPVGCTGARLVVTLLHDDDEKGPASRAGYALRGRRPGLRGGPGKIEKITACARGRAQVGA